MNAPLKSDWTLEELDQQFHIWEHKHCMEAVPEGHQSIDKSHNFNQLVLAILQREQYFDEIVQKREDLANLCW